MVYYEFKKELYFYDLVSSFSISLCGCPIIFDKQFSADLSPTLSISFPGKYTESKQMLPYSLSVMADKGYLSKSKHIAACCTMLANTAYESVKHFNDQSELFEFFRHIRNASSHLNVFQFNQKEPAHPARWRGATLDHTLKGEANPLHNKACFGYFIGVADLLELLMDIEQAIIKQSHGNSV